MECACEYDGSKITEPCVLHAEWAREWVNSSSKVEGGKVEGLKGRPDPEHVVEATASPIERPLPPIPMILWCPCCGTRHIDVGVFEHKFHHTHACQHCGMGWRPAIVYTVGVQFLPGFKDGEEIKPCA